MSLHVMNQPATTEALNTSSDARMGQACNPAVSYPCNWKNYHIEEHNKEDFEHNFDSNFISIN